MPFRRADMTSLNLLALAAVPLVALAAAAPAAAQENGPVDSPNERVNQLIVYGDNKCHDSTVNDITVCARKPVGERFRIPKDLRIEPKTHSETKTNKVESY